MELAEENKDLPMPLMKVVCLDEDTQYWFSARTPYEAMSKLIYSLNIAHEDKTAVINKTESGNFMWCVHCGKTWCVYSR